MSSPHESKSTSTSVWGNSKCTSVLLGIFVLQLIVISWTIYSTIESRLEPTALVDQGEKAIRQNYAEIRQDFTNTVKEQAPEIAAQVSDELVAASPEIRQWLEQVAKRQLRYSLEAGTELSADEFREFLRENHDTIEEAFVKIESVPEESEELVLDLEAQVDERWGVDLENQAKQALQLHRALNDKLESLEGSGPLEPKELLEQRMIRILKSLEDKHLAALH